MMRRNLHLALLAALLAGGAQAQDEGPGVSTSADLPAVSTPAAPASAGASDAAAVEAGGGTVIVGDRESPIGLYIMPWRNSAAQADMDRPARLLQSEVLPLDEAVFIRQIEYHNALTDTLKSRDLVTPDLPGAARP